MTSKNSPASDFESAYIQPALARRREMGSLRRLTPFRKKNMIDFSSNDYLGLAHSQNQHAQVTVEYQKLERHLVGSTGSRLLTGDSEYAHQLEDRLATWHNRPAALVCNSGYDANLAVLSCVTRQNVVIMDELSHNSLYMGVQLGQGKPVTFKHNSVQDLERVLQKQSTNQRILIVVESVYSMDGDIGPLSEILVLALLYNASVIVDEAHGLGVFGSNGMGVLAELRLECHPALLCSIHTFGKAAGCHGAVVCGSLALKEYLINYGRPIVYSTSLPLHSLVCISCAYESMSSDAGAALRTQVKDLVRLFRQGMQRLFDPSQSSAVSLVPSETPIQALLVPGNKCCVDFCELLCKKSGDRIRLYPIRSPTVPTGQERVRIIIHSHNTKDQVGELLLLMEETLQDMGYLKGQSRVFQSRL
jgi:8-amino-7-oxononanoate synthase